MTEIDIFNKALYKTHTIAKLESADGTIEGASGDELVVDLAKTFYHDSRRQILRMAPWTCVQTRAKLQPEQGTENLTPFIYKAKLPEDYINQTEVYNSTGRKIDFLIMSGYLYSNEANPILVYTRDEPDPEQWDPLLQEAIVTQIASAISYPLTGSHENEVAYAQAAAMITQQALTQSAREKNQGQRLGDEWFPGLFNRNSETKL